MTWTRVATAAVLAPLVVAAVWWGPAWMLALLVAACALQCLREYFAVCRQAGHRPYALAGYACALIILGFQWAWSHRGTWADGWQRLFVAGSPPPLEMALFLCLLMLAAQALASRDGAGNAAASFGVSAASLLLIVLPFSYLLRLRGEWENGRTLVMFALLVVWVGDTAAYFVGRAIGRHRLAPAISPQKTWEGAIANVLGSAGVGYVLWHASAALYLRHFIAAAIIASLAGQAGDLLQSAIKRSAGVKDSGALLPGHGGLWDRLDALIFAVPAVWWYLSALEFIIRRYDLR
jgi:phosphatidate cytidylyltransferase